MNWLPTLEYGLSHPYPKGHWFLIAAIIMLLFTVPSLVVVNLVTLGYDLVPSLQPRFQPNDTRLEGWWGRRRLPPMLRPRTPPCEPQSLGRGDVFRLSASLFDYTVMSTWNTSEGPRPSKVQEQKRVEYRDQSFTNCYANSVLLDYSMVEQTQTVSVGVLCPGYTEYPIEITMQTTVTFAWMLSKDYIGQFYGLGRRLLNLNDTDPSDYRRVVLATLQVISTDSLTIMRHSNLHLSNPLLSASVYFDVDPDTAGLIHTASTLAYMNGTIPPQFPREGTIYFDTIMNLVTVATHAVNLDLGNRRSPNIFRNGSLLSSVLNPNLAPNDTEFRISPADWAEGSKPFYFEQLGSLYQTWAQALLDRQPVRLDNLTELPDESIMVTSYLCPSYQIKPIGALLASVFVGSATMILSVWGVWMYFSTLLARYIREPEVVCYCSDCNYRREKEAEKARVREANPELTRTGAASRFAAFLGLSRLEKSAKPSYTFADIEKAHFNRLAYGGSPQPGRYPSSVGGHITG